MKFTYRLLSFLLTGTSFCNALPAQENEPYRIPEEGAFVLCGKAENVPATEKMFRLAVCHPFDNKGAEVPLGADGSFRQALPIAGMQDIYLYLGDAVTLFSYPGDTVTLTFDYADLPGSIRLSGTTPERTRELELCLKLYRTYREPFLDFGAIRKELYKKGLPVTDTCMLNAVARYATDYRKSIQAFTAAHGAVPHEDYLVQQGYFGALSNVASSPEALARLYYPPYSLRCYDGAKQEQKPLYTCRAFNPFLSSSATDFMMTYLASNLGRTAALFEHAGPAETFASQTALAGCAIPQKALRDWYLAVSFQRGMNWFGWKPTEAMKLAGQECLASLACAPAKACMEQVLEQHFSRLAPGSPAPAFTLPDEQGHPVSLDDLKGKIVYLDFWSDGCGPCISEFRQQEAFHRKYAAYEDKIAYVYICLGSSEKRWKELIGKYNLNGINLHTTSWEDPRINAYSNNAVPLYVLIDPEGRLIEYNTLRPSDLAQDAPNLLDKALNRR